MKISTDALVISTIKKNANGIKFWGKNYYCFSIDDIETYLKIFEQLKVEGYILEGQFNDNSWYVTNKKEDTQCVTITFPFETHSEINLSLKAFWLICVKEKIYDAFNLVSRMIPLYNIIYTSNNFNEKMFDEFSDWFEITTTLEDSKMVKAHWKSVRKSAIRYLNFVDSASKNIYITIINRMLNKKTRIRARAIPPFKHLLTFDELINDFYKLKDEDVKYLQDTYMPVYIWWKLTTVIPIRIGEFVRLKLDCVYYDEEKKGYYIDIPRIKNKEKIDTDTVLGVEYVIQTLKIHESIAKLILDFKSTCDKKETFLFNYKFYFEHLTTGNKNSVEKCSKVDKTILTTKNFRYLLKRFYNNIIKKTYGEKICFKDRYRLPKDFDNKIIALQPGDTRHIAVSNLVELGVNPLSIAWYCHHDSIKTQDNYSRYILEEAEVKAKLLGRKLASMYKRANEISIQTRKIDIIKAHIKLDEGGFQVDYGVCGAPHGMFDCEEIECLFCNYFTPIVTKENKVMIKRIVTEHRKNIMMEFEKIQTTITFLIDQLNVTISKDENDHFQGAVREESLIQNAYNQTVELKNKLAKVEAMSYLAEEI